MCSYRSMDGVVYALRRWLACGLGALTLIGSALPAAAAIVYESPSNRVIASGRVSLFSSWLHDVPGDDHDIKNAGTRIRGIVEHNFSHGWSGVARSEWGFDPLLDTGKPEFFKREQYVGLSHPRYGSFVLGKQYSLWYDMVGVWTDYFWINGTTAQGSFNGRRADGGFEGNGRADRALSYRNRFGRWSVGALVQGKRDSTHVEQVPRFVFNAGQRIFDGMQDQLEGVQRNYTAQAAVDFHAGHHLTLGAAYTHSDIDHHESHSVGHPDVDAGLLGARWTPGHWYLALTAGQYHNLVRSSSFGGYADNHAIDTARGYEAIGIYDITDTFPGHVQLYGGFNRLEDHDSDARNMTYIEGAAWLVFHSNLIFAVEQTQDDSTDIHGRHIKGNSTEALVRYNF